MKINEENYKEFLLRYMEEDLSAEELAEVDGFIEEEPVAIQELRALERTKAQPDMKIVFPHKDRLKKKANNVTEAPVRKLMWYASSVASIAAMLVIAILFYNEFAGKNQEHAMLSEQGSLSNIAGGLSDEQFAGEVNSFVLADDSEKNDISFSESNHVAGVVPSAPALKYKKNIANVSSLKVNKKPEEVVKPELKNLNTKPGVIQSAKTDEKMAEVSRQQLQAAMNLLKNRTIAYAEASYKFAPAGDVSGHIAGVQKKSATVHKNTADSENASGMSEEEEDMSGQPILSALNSIFRKHVSIKKKKQDNHLYYALTIETPGLKISKRIKSDN